MNNTNESKYKLIVKQNQMMFYFFFSIFQGGIGLNVAQMIVELIRDKRKIVDRITHAQIDEFVGLLQKNQVRNFFMFTGTIG